MACESLTSARTFTTVQPNPLSVAPVSSESPLRDPFVRPLNLTPSERAALIAFLNALTDETFVTDPRHANPW